MDGDRRLSYLILKDIEENDAWSNLAISSFLKKNECDNPGFIRELVYGVLRNKYLLDYNIDRFLRKPNISLDERIWLRMGFYQLKFMSGVKPYTSVNESAKLAKKFKPGTEGFINAVLRNFQRDDCKLSWPNEEEDILESLHIRYSVHKNIADLWLKSYGFEKTKELLEASLSVSPLVIRVNTLKISRDELIAKLCELGFDAKAGSLAKSSIIVSGKALLDTDLYKKGYFSVQGESSQYAVEILNPAPKSIVLDLCAAPGGKSCAMAENMQNIGKIYSFDIYEKRVGLIDKEKERLGLSIIQAALGDASVYNPKLDSIADFVLADVPCTGLGTLRENPEIKFRSPEDIACQRAILENALKYVKKGGTVLYSTCTINPKENEKITQGFNIIEEHQLFTEKGGPDGFYICKIRRD